MWWVRSDPCGLFSAGFTVFLILFAEYTIVSVILLPWYGFSYHVVLYTILAGLALYSHSCAQFTDPGAVPKIRVAVRTLLRFALSFTGLSAQPPVETVSVDPTTGTVAPPLKPVPRVCKKCKAVKPPKSHHCSTCGRCIIRMDHHCPWVNNCVAIFNQKYFILFLLYTGICCIYSGVLLVARFISCTHNVRQCSVSGMQAVLAVLCFVEALVFGLFVTIMMFDQISAIFENTPGIDALQNRKGDKRGKYESLQEVFGERVSWRWLFPLRQTTRIFSDFEYEIAQEELQAMVPAAGSSAAMGAGMVGVGGLGQHAPPHQFGGHSHAGHNNHHGHSHAHGNHHGHSHSHGEHDPHSD